MDHLEDCPMPYQHYDLPQPTLTTNVFDVPVVAAHHGTPSSLNSFQQLQGWWYPDNSMITHGMYNSSISLPACPTEETQIQDIDHHAIVRSPTVAGGRRRKYMSTSENVKLTNKYKEKRRKNLESVKKCRERKRTQLRYQAASESESVASTSMSYAELLHEYEQMKIKLSELEIANSNLLSRLSNCSHCAVHN